MALLNRTHQIAPDMSFSTSGTPVCSVVCASDTPPDSGSRLGSRLARVRECLKGAFVKSPAVFEIRNMRTGEPAVQLGTFPDGTLAERAARDLGHEWRVFRQETGPDQNPRSSCEAAPDTNQPVESSLPPTQVPSGRQSQHPIQFTSENLESLRQAVQHSQPVAPALPSETYAPSAHGKSLFQSSRLSEHIRFDHGQVTIEFGNPVELEERLVLFSYVISNEPEIAEPYSTGIVPEVLVELEHR